MILSKKPHKTKKFKEYTPSQVRKIHQLAREGHKTHTIAVSMDLDEETLEANFGDRMRQLRVEGKIALKRAQIAKAVDGTKDSTMLIWLGKNELEQTDKQTVEHTGNLVINLVNYAKDDTP